MDFDLTEDQKEIKRVAHELLASRAPWIKVREHAQDGRYDDGLRRELTELGWPGIAVPEAQGGQGLGLVELTTLAEEAGYALAPAPFVPTAAVAATLSAAEAGVDLGPLLAGEAYAGFGTRELAADAPGAALVVLLEEDGAVLLRDPQVEPFSTIDPTRRYGSVSAGDATPLEPGSAERIRIVLAAETLGVCQRALEMTLDYVKDRKQFGVAVGAFQAVSHRCAQMLFDTEGLRSALLFAAWTADAAPDRLAEGAALAAAAAARAGREVAASAIQAHGGIGFTWEADVHWLYKRAQLNAQLLGGSGHHHVRLARIAAERATVAAG